MNADNCHGFHLLEQSLGETKRFPFSRKKNPPKLIENILE